MGKADTKLVYIVEIKMINMIIEALALILSIK